MARQQTLGLRVPDARTYGLWVQHANLGELSAITAGWLVKGGRYWIASEQPAGKTHFLHAIQQEHPHLGLLRIRNTPCNQLEQTRIWSQQLEPYQFWLLDIDAGALATSVAFALFHLLECGKQMNTHILLAWRAPKDTSLGPVEFHSRMMAMPRIDIAPPDNDHDLKSVLLSVAMARQSALDEGMADYMLTRLPRNLDGLLQTLEKMEITALEAGRRMTIAWTREYLKKL